MECGHPAAVWLLICLLPCLALPCPALLCQVEYKELKGRTLLAVPGYDEPVEFGAITSFAYPLEDAAGVVTSPCSARQRMLPVMEQVQHG